MNAKTLTRTLGVVLLLSVFSFNSQAVNTLTQGDIAFTHFISDNTPGDEFTFVALVDIDAGVEIIFTDNGWQSSNSFRSGEQQITWTAPLGGTSYGSYVTISGSGASEGSYTGTFLALSSSGDQIFACWNGTSLNDIIAGINWEAGAWGSNATSSSTTALPSSLTNGTNAVTMTTERDNGEFTACSSLTTGAANAAANRAEFNDATNWTIDDDPNQIGASPPCSGALPVEFLSFDAKLEGPVVLLSWATATEITNDRFEIERSTDVMNDRWTTIGEVKGAGNSAVILRYRFMDTEPRTSATTYYRLRQVDYNGDYSYSNIVSVSDKTSEVFYATLSPNPVRNEGNLELVMPQSGTVTIAVMDKVGTVMTRTTADVTKGVNRISLTRDIANLRSGVYFVKVADQYQEQTLKLVKK